MITLAFIMVQGLQARAGRKRDEGGASVLEWALIAAVVVVAASIIGAVIYNIVSTKSSDLQKCADKAAGTKC